MLFRSFNRKKSVGNNSLSEVIFNLLFIRIRKPSRNILKYRNPIHFGNTVQDTFSLESRYQPWPDNEYVLLHF